MRTITILATILLLTLFSACKKDTSAARQTHYVFIAQNNSGVSGTVSFIEKADSSQTTVDIELNNIPANQYLAHIHQGPPTSYHGAIYYFDPIPASAGKISYKQNILLLYDSALTLNCTFVLHDSTGNQTLGICGVGINK